MLCALCGDETDGTLHDGNGNIFCSERCYYAFHNELPKQSELPRQGDPGDCDPEPRIPDESYPWE